MKIACLPNNERKSLLVITVDGEPWRQVHPSIFGYRPALLKECPSLEQLAEQFAVLEYRQARQYAIKRLSLLHMPSTTLIKSLTQRLVSEGTIQRLIEELCSLGYLNDQEWIASFIRVQSQRKMGPRAIARKLASKGLSAGQVETTLRESQTTDDQKHSIKQLLSKRYRMRNLSDFKERKKVVAALVRRGFDLSLVLDLVGKDHGSDEDNFFE